MALGLPFSFLLFVSWVSVVTLLSSQVGVLTECVWLCGVLFGWLVHGCLGSVVLHDLVLVPLLEVQSLMGSAALLVGGVCGHASHNVSELVCSVGSVAALGVFVLLVHGVHAAARLILAAWA